MGNDVAAAWNRIESYIRAKFPLTAPRFLPPVTDAELAHAEKVLRRPLPCELVSLYRQHNGVTVSGFLPDAWDSDNLMAFSLICVEDLLTYWRQNNELQATGEIPKPSLWTPFAGYWSSEWIPFATDGAANLQCIDEAKNNRIIQFDHESYEFKVLGDSLATYLNDVAEKIENGTYRVFEIEYDQDGNPVTPVSRKIRPESSFDDSLPPNDRFSVLITDDSFHLYCQERDAPVDEEQLTRRGYHLGQLTQAFLNIIASCSQCSADDLMVEFDDAGDEGDMNFNYHAIPLANATQRLMINVACGTIDITLSAATVVRDVTKFDEVRFQESITDLFRILHQNRMSTHFESMVSYNQKPGYPDFSMKYHLEPV